MNSLRTLRYVKSIEPVNHGDLYPLFQGDKSYSIPPGPKGYASVTCENGERPLKRENPHKYLLYKPTFSQIMVFLASGKKF